MYLGHIFRFSKISNFNRRALQIVFATLIWAQIIDLSVASGALWTFTETRIRRLPQYRSAISYREAATDGNYSAVVIGNANFNRLVANIIPYRTRIAKVYSPQRDLRDTETVIQLFRKAEVEFIIVQNLPTLWSDFLGRGRAPKINTKLLKYELTWKFSLFPIDGVKLFFTTLSDWARAAPKQKHTPIRPATLKGVVFSVNPRHARFLRAIKKLRSKLYWVTDYDTLPVTTNKQLVDSFETYFSEKKFSRRYGRFLKIGELTNELEKLR